METWLVWARGPLFVAALAVLVAGLARIVLLNAVTLVLLWRRTRQNGRTIAWRRIAANSLAALRPFPADRGARPLYSVVSIVFHVSIIVTPIFLAAHVMLWERGLGIGWAALGATAADALTLVAIGSTALLFLMRLAARDSRALSRPQDYLVLLLLGAPFVSGYLAMHPSINPFTYDAAMLVHVLSGNLILVLIPFSKLSHVVLLPISQVIAELGWHLQPGAGARIAAELGKENQPI